MYSIHERGVQHKVCGAWHIALAQARLLPWGVLEKLGWGVLQHRVSVNSVKRALIMEGLHAFMRSMWKNALADTLDG